jgi:hypothetical protein
VPDGTPARRGSPALAALTGLLVLADAGLAAIGLLVWNAYRGDNLTGAEAATFVLLGVSAAIGALVLAAAAAGLVRGERGIARAAAVLARLRAGALVVALVIVAVRVGGSALAGLLETTGAIVAVGDAVIALWVTGVAVRRTHDR